MGLLAAVVLNSCRVIRTIDQFYKRHRCIITLTETHFQDTEITAIACRVTWAEFCEQLEHNFTIAQPIERETLVRQGVCFAQSQNGLDDATQFFCFGQRGLDCFMTKLRDCHVAQHGKAM